MTSGRVRALTFPLALVVVRVRQDMPNKHHLVPVEDFNDLVVRGRRSTADVGLRQGYLRRDALEPRPLCGLRLGYVPSRLGMQAPPRRSFPATKRLWSMKQLPELSNVRSRVYRNLSHFLS